MTRRISLPGADELFRKTTLSAVPDQSVEEVEVAHTNRPTTSSVATTITFPSPVYLQDGDFDGDTAVYVGGTAVTTSNGVKLSKTNTTVFQLNADDVLYAIGSGATSSVRVTEVK